MANIKRSMAVFPSPIVIEDDKVRHPKDEERFTRNDIGYRVAKYWDGTWGYTVSRVTNSTDYSPGDPVTKLLVDRLIEDGWTITILKEGGR